MSVATETLAENTARRGVLRSPALAAVLLVGVGGALYAPSLTVPFIYEDRHAILNNESIRRLWPPWDALAPPRLSTIEGRPLVNFSLAVNWALGGLDVRGYHAVNVVAHVLAALSLYGIVRRTLAGPALRARWGAAAPGAALAVALVWTVHPLQTETVVYTHQRTELLMSLFYLLTLWCVIRGWEGRPGRWGAAAVAASALGMGCKEVMATAPLMVLLYDRSFVSGSFGSALRRHPGLYAGLAGTWLVLAGVLDLREDSVGFHLGITPVQYLMTQAGVIARYLRLTVWPDPLLIAYDWPIVRGLSDVLPAALLVGALFAGTLWGLVRRPQLGFLGAWFFVILAPTSSVLPIVFEIVAERRMYLPLAAVVILATLGGDAVLQWLARGWTPQRRQGLAAVAVGLVVAALAARTSARIEDYRDERGLWEDVLVHYPRHPSAHGDLGVFLEREGRFEEAMAHYAEAVRLAPDLAPAHWNLAHGFLRQGDRARAAEHFRAVLALDPDVPEAHNQIGRLLHEDGRLEEAVRHYREALRRDAAFTEARANLGAALAALGRLDEAVVQLAEAVRLEPDDMNAQYNLGTAMVARGHPEPALGHLGEVVRRRPDFVPGHHQLAVALAAAGRPDEARAHWRTALRLARAQGQAALAQEIERYLRRADRADDAPAR